MAHSSDAVTNRYLDLRKIGRPRLSDSPAAPRVAQGGGCRMKAAATSARVLIF
jgi:hypothetical protein